MKPVGLYDLDDELCMWGNKDVDRVVESINQTLREEYTFERAIGREAFKSSFCLSRILQDVFPDAMWEDLERLQSTFGMAALHRFRWAGWNVSLSSRSWVTLSETHIEFGAEAMAILRELSTVLKQYDPEATLRAAREATRRGR